MNGRDVQVCLSQSLAGPLDLDNYEAMQASAIGVMPNACNSHSRKISLAFALMFGHHNVQFEIIS